jgi:hypothetical protein
MAKTIYRYQVPIDDRAHILALSSDPVSVAISPDLTYMEFWAEHHSGAGVRDRAFQVYGTGHPVPDGAEYVGTAPRTRLGLVFHLYELEA